MERMYYNQIYHSILNSSKSAGTLSILNITKNETDKGSLVLFVEIETSDKDNEHIVQTLNQELEKNYYQSPAQSVEYKFENALTKANIAIKEKLLIKPKDWLQKIHIAVVAMKDAEVHLASVGRMHAFFVHGTFANDVLIPSASEHHAQHSYASTPNPVKLFTNIVSGTLNKNDSLIVLNESVLDYLSPERIRKTAHDMGPEEAVGHLSALLKKAPQSKQFGLIAIKHIEEKHQAVSEQTVRHIEHLSAIKSPRRDRAAVSPAKQAALEAHPATSGALNATHGNRQMTRSAPKTRQNAHQASPIVSEKQHVHNDDILEKYLRPTHPQDIDSTPKIKKGSTIKKALQRSTSKVIASLLNIISKLLDVVQMLLAKTMRALQKLPGVLAAILKDKNARTYHMGKAHARMQTAFHALIRRFTSLKKMQQAALIGCAALVVVFSVTTVLRAYRQNERLEQEAFRNTTSLIEQKISEAESALIYDNRTRAKEILNEIAAQLEDFPQNKDEYKTAYETYHERYRALLNKNEKKTELSLVPLATIVPTPASFDRQGLVAVGSNLYYYNGEKMQIALIDTEAGLIIDIPLSGQEIEPFDRALAFGENRIVTIRNDQVAFLNIENETLVKEQFNVNRSPDTPLSSYATNLYALDAPANEIVRYRGAARGFSTGQQWLAEPADLEGTLSLAVDGSVHLLHADGRIYSFLKGVLDRIIPSPVEDALGNSSRLYTNENLEYFIILDAEHRRIIQSTKRGNLVTQYIAPEFEHAQYIAISANTLYVLSRDQIFAIELIAQ